MERIRPRIFSSQLNHRRRVKTLVLSPSIKEAIANVREVEGTFVMGRDSMTILEVAKINLANVVIRELESQRRTQLPARADRGVVHVRLLPVRRRSAS